MPCAECEAKTREVNNDKIEMARKIANKEAKERGLTQYAITRGINGTTYGWREVGHPDLDRLTVVGYYLVN